MRRPPCLIIALLWPALAQATPLKIATWNLDWLTTRPQSDPALPADVQRRRPADFARLAQYAAILNADVVAFQEVDGEQPAALLFPPARYALQLTHDAVVQRVGFAVRQGLSFTANPDVTALDIPRPGAAQHLRSGADITLNLPGGRKLRLLAIHLKSGCQEDRSRPDREACTLLAAQTAPLAAWIAARQAEHTPFAVLGDFNRVLASGDPFLQTLAASGPLLRPTEGFANPCWGGENFIDHILLGGAAAAWLVPRSLLVLVYKETDRRQDWRLSDHCAVSVRVE